MGVRNVSYAKPKLTALNTGVRPRHQLSTTYHFRVTPSTLYLIPPWLDLLQRRMWFLKLLHQKCIIAVKKPQQHYRFNHVTWSHDSVTSQPPIIFTDTNSAGNSAFCPEVQPKEVALLYLNHLDSGMCDHLCNSQAVPHLDIGPLSTDTYTLLIPTWLWKLMTEKTLKKKI